MHYSLNTASIRSLVVEDFPIFVTFTHLTMCLKAQSLLNCFLWGLSNKFGVFNGMIFSFLCPYSLKLSLTKYRRNSRKLCALISLMLVLGPNSTAGCFNCWFNFITSKFRKQIFCIFWIFLKYHLGSLILKYFIPTYLFLSAPVSFDLCCQYSTLDSRNGISV